jgi:hypothetical protein
MVTERPLGIIDNVVRPLKDGASSSVSPPHAPLAAPVEPFINDEMQIAAAQLLSTGEEGQESVKTITKVLHNILKSPEEQKFRHLKR